LNPESEGGKPPEEGRKERGGGKIKEIRKAKLRPQNRSYGGTETMKEGYLRA